MILFDLSYFSHRIIWPNKEQILENPHFYAHLITTQILQFAKRLGASKKNRMVLCLDSPSWRKDYYVEHSANFAEYVDKDGNKLTYKGNRVKDDTIPWDSINDTTALLTEAFKQHSDFNVMKVAGAEADDIIATLAKRFKSSETIWVCSPDKDFIQLQEKGVYIYDPMKNDFKPEQDVETFKKIHNMIGDKSDNILAFKSRVGEKTAIKLLKDLRNILTSDPEAKKRYIFNMNLIDLSMIPCHVSDAINAEWETQAHHENIFNPMNLMKIFMHFGMSKIAEDIGLFKLSENEVKTSVNQYFINKDKNAELSRNNLEDFFD